MQLAYPKGIIHTARLSISVKSGERASVVCGGLWQIGNEFATEKGQKLFTMHARAKWIVSLHPAADDDDGRVERESESSLSLLVPRTH